MGYCLFWVSVHVLRVSTWFPLISCHHWKACQKHAVYSKLSLGVKCVWIRVCMLPCNGLASHLGCISTLHTMVLEQDLDPPWFWPVWSVMWDRWMNRQLTFWIGEKYSPITFGTHWFYLLGSFWIIISGLERISTKYFLAKICYVVYYCVAVRYTYI